MLQNHTGTLKTPLTTGASDRPAITQGQTTQFQLSSIPAFVGSMAVYLCGIKLLIRGRLTQAGGTGVRMSYLYDLIRSLIASVEVKNAWHGVPMKQAFTTGGHLPVISFVANGYRWLGNGVRAFIPAVNGTNDFALELFLPLGYMGTYKKGHHLAQLALLYRKAVLEITWSAAAVGAAISPGSSFSVLTCQATARSILDPELRLGPGSEWVLYQTQFSAGTLLDFQSFASSTGLDGVQNGGGIDFCHLMTEVSGMQGAFLGTELTRLGVPFRAQTETDDIASYVDEARDAMGPMRNQGVADAAAIPAYHDKHDWPNQADAVDVAAGTTNPITDALLSVPIVTPPYQGELSKIQYVNQNVQLQATFTGGAGTHQLLTHQLKEWTPTKIDDAARQMVDSGLAREILGPSAGGYEWETKTLNKQAPTDIIDVKTGDINIKKMRFFPLRLTPKKAA